MTFCNTFPRGLCLGIFDTDNLKFDYVDLGEKNKFLMGATGITYKNNFWILIQTGINGETGLLELDNKFNILNQYKLNKIKDGHGIISYKDGFLIANTGMNEIVYLEVKNSEVHQKIFYSHDLTKTDTVHINSIVKVNDNILCSMFGKKPKEGWKNSEQGVITNITKNKTIVKNLEHPHSLCVYNNNIFFLESKNGIIYKLDNQEKLQKVMNVKGYLRGIALDSKYAYVGVSKSRRRSKSTGVINIDVSEDPDLLHCYISKIDLEDNKIEKIDLTSYTNEIFDIHIIPFKIENNNSEPILKRFEKFEEEYEELREWKEHYRDLYEKSKS